MRSLLLLVVVIMNSISTNAQLLVEKIQLFTSDKLHDVEFINDSVGFAYTYGTGKVFKTMDQGKSWSLVLQTDSIYLEQIQFVNNNVGFICGEKGTLYKTSDQGNTWDNVSIKNDTANVLIYGLHFKNVSQGLIGAGLYANRKLQPVLLETSDGAQAFKPTKWDYPKMVLNVMVNNNALWKTGAGYILKDSLEVFKDTSKQIGQIRSLDFGDNETIIAVSFNGYATISRDKANSWETKKVCDSRLRSICYLGNETWFAVGDKSKNGKASNFISYNNGETWEVYNNEIPDLHRCFKQNKYLWLAGDKGFVAKISKLN